MKGLKTRIMTWRLGRAIRILAIVFAPQPREMLAVIHGLACSMVMAGGLMVSCQGQVLVPWLPQDCHLGLSWGSGCRCPPYYAQS